MGRRWTLGVTLVVAMLVALPSDAGAKAPRTVLVLPFVPVDLPREEQWIGEGVAQSLSLALGHMPRLVQIDRQRLRHAPQPDIWDDQAVQAAAKLVRAEVALYGEVRRVAGQLSLHGRLFEVKNDRSERATLEPLAVPGDQLLGALGRLALVYARSLNVSLSEADVARVQKRASPTTSPRAYEAYVRGRLGWYRGGQDGNEAAVELLGRAVEIDAHFVAAQFALGMVHQSLGNRWKAAAQYRAATQLDPTYPEPYKALGDLFLTAPRRLFDQAAEAYEKAIELRPFFAEAHVGLGDAKAAKGDVDGAVASYRQALVHNPVNARVYVSLGKIYYTEKALYYEAVGAYKKAIDLDPQLPDARMGLAEVYEDKGLYQEAIAEYSKVVEMDARNTNALYSLALVYEKVDPKEAITLWERYIQLASPLPSEKDWVDVARLHLRKLKGQLEKEKAK
jgi:adenylate cyclase